MQYLEEFPLVLFTLLVQTSIGIIFVGQRLLSRNTDDIVRKRIRFQSAIALFLFAIAMVISLIHTGSPLHSPFTILHVTSSWLSREILMMGITGASLLYLVFLRLKPFSTIETFVAYLTVILGTFLCFAMSNIYNQPLTPGWYTPAVFPLYISSALMLGAFWHGVTLSVKRPAVLKASGSELYPVLFWSVAGYILMATFIPISLPDQAIAVNPWTTLIPYACIKYSHGVHALLSGIAIFLLVQSVFRNFNRHKMSSALLLTAFIFLIAGEIMGRLTFYLSYSRVGM